MNVELFPRKSLRRRGARSAVRPPQLQLVEEPALADEEDVGAVRLLRLQAALRERRVAGTEG